MKVCLNMDDVLAEILRARRALAGLDAVQGAPAEREDQRGGEVWTCAAPKPAAPPIDDRVPVKPRARNRLSATRSVSAETLALSKALSKALELPEGRVFDLALHAMLGSLPVETRSKVQLHLLGGRS